MVHVDSLVELEGGMDGDAAVGGGGGADRKSERSGAGERAAGRHSGHGGGAPSGGKGSLVPLGDSGSPPARRGGGAKRRRAARRAARRTHHGGASGAAASAAAVGGAGGARGRAGGERGHEHGDGEKEGGGGGAARGAPSDARSVVEEITRLDGLAAEREAAGEMLEGLRAREEALVLRQGQLGVGHPDLERACQYLVLQYNSLAMQSMDGDESVPTQLLKKADSLTAAAGLFPDEDSRLKLRALTHNNFGCVYLHFGLLHTALKSLERALKIENANPDLCENPGGTHLNVCAILSQMKR